MGGKATLKGEIWGAVERIGGTCAGMEMSCHRVFKFFMMQAIWCDICCFSRALLMMISEDEDDVNGVRLVACRIVFGVGVADDISHMQYETLLT